MNFNKENYTNIKEEILFASKSYMSKEEQDKFTTHVENKLDNFKPTIMVYGVYNAGKSTLLNALFGEKDMAKMGDSPETAEVKAYNYNGYTIYDTPGINAPIEHQKVTNEHINKCELILFVLSNDGSFEEEYIYEKIADVIKGNKPILIVLNNKSGINMDSNDALESFNKVNQHLCTICDRLGVQKAEEKVNISFIDALTALEGKIENEQELINESKIEELEQQIDKLLGNAGVEEVSNGLNIYISKYVQNTISIIVRQIDNPEMKKTQELITYLEKLKERLFIELKDTAMQSATIATANLIELMLSKDTDGINTMISKTTEEISQKINKRIKEVQEEIKHKVDNFKIEFEQLNIDKPILNSNIDTNIQTIPTEATNKKSAMISSTGMIVSQAIPPTLIIPTPIGPIPVKPLVMIASTLFAAFSSSSEARVNAEAKLEAKRVHHLGAKNKSEEFGINFKEELIVSVTKNINNSFGSILKQFTEFSKELEYTNETLLRDKETLQNILTKMQN